MKPVVFYSALCVLFVSIAARGYPWFWVLAAVSGLLALVCSYMSGVGKLLLETHISNSIREVVRVVNLEKCTVAIVRTRNGKLLACRSVGVVFTKFDIQGDKDKFLVPSE